MIVMKDKKQQQIKLVEESLQHIFDKKLIKKLLSILDKWEFYYTSRTREIYRLEYSTQLRITQFFKAKYQIVDQIQKLVDLDQN